MSTDVIVAGIGAVAVVVGAAVTGVFALVAQVRKQIRPSNGVRLAEYVEATSQQVRATLQAVGRIEGAQQHTQTRVEQLSLYLADHTMADAVSFAEVQAAINATNEKLEKLEKLDATRNLKETPND